MIIKLDHITYVDSRENYKDYENIETKFKEICLKNPKGKREFMFYMQEDADLYFIEGNIAREVVLYNKILAPSEIVFSGEAIYAKFKGNVDNVVDLLSDIFKKGVEKINEGKIVCNVKGIFDKSNYFIYFERDDDFEPAYLDRKGINCPCFLVESIDNTLAQIDDVNTKLSSSDKIIVNKRKLEIVFLRSTNLNIIFEFISPCH